MNKRLLLIIGLLLAVLFSAFFIFSSWRIRNVKGLYFNGLVISLGKLTDAEGDYDNIGFIQISSEKAEVDTNSVRDYIVGLKNNEQKRVKAGGFPQTPGPSEFEYIGSISKIAPKGYEEISSLATIGSNTEAHLFWKIKDNKLYQVLVKYPNDSAKKANFEFGLNVVNLFF